MVTVVTEQWQATPPSEEDMTKMEWDCKGADELLTQCLLRLDNIETGSELRERRRGCLKRIEALQDGSVVCVREAVNAFRNMAAQAAAEGAPADDGRTPPAAAPGKRPAR